ncbi:MAG: DNA-formamidopyrimidine glycosylase [Candidatus Portnoybacteria bacterium CG10_big_fil_rev_8_21_14_0_10_44_7]|uniref:DNA-formamidopyrimidine glycosylase n=1 Tax=Candidatus Portnoybacteria bacterium CG10_big_fil_rev_8_21_14_0_10_44_7 TaxID=1974816 RepID=A0A2M8KIC8_9BACT|nr:MAG: DNA-formamidopyrimidine glycosylase [Candidatus Portnoybacteria bacterium CG10_big_fil_rev_8_21_14_0_10_44_7]
MPELPEVETIKNQLNCLILGKQIKAVKILLPKIVKTNRAFFILVLTGKHFIKIYRRAKIFIFELSGNWSMIAHLKMTGQLVYAKNKNEFLKQKNKHTHVFFEFNDGSFLLFNDLRQFGWLKLIKKNAVDKEIQAEKLGPEPLEKEFTLAIFKKILATRPKKAIKPLLMDPYLIAGIGNIYSDEILFYSRILPTRPAASLKEKEIKTIYQNIKKILRAAIKARGTSAADYLDAFGAEGDYDKQLKVYGQKKSVCPICGGPIKRQKISGRTAHFCPKCQK